jgi:DedD protein
LIAPPVQESGALTTGPASPVVPPPPPQVVNNETLSPPPPAATASSQSAPVTESLSENNALAGKAYLIQVGVFTSPANAQALQKQLKRAGIDARLETRVQLGPFKDKRDADKALARARKLGINAVLVSAR